MPPGSAKYVIPRPKGTENFSVRGVAISPGGNADDRSLCWKTYLKWGVAARRFPRLWQEEAMLSCLAAHPTNTARGV
jgi:hypothetical protein